jgi:hypothetical protein
MRYGIMGSCSCASAALRHSYVWWSGSIAAHIPTVKATTQLRGRPHDPAAILPVLVSTGRAATDKRKTI